MVSTDVGSINQCSIPALSPSNTDRLQFDVAEKKGGSKGERAYIIKLAKFSCKSDMSFVVELSLSEDEDSVLSGELRQSAFKISCQAFDVLPSLSQDE